MADWRRSGAPGEPPPPPSRTEVWVTQKAILSPVATVHFERGIAAWLLSWFPGAPESRHLRPGLVSWFKRQDLTDPWIRAIVAKPTRDAAASHLVEQLLGVGQPPTWLEGTFAPARPAGSRGVHPGQREVAIAGGRSALRSAPRAAGGEMAKGNAGMRTRPGKGGLSSHTMPRPPRPVRRGSDTRPHEESSLVPVLPCGHRVDDLHESCATCQEHFDRLERPSSDGGASLQVEHPRVVHGQGWWRSGSQAQTRPGSRTTCPSFGDRGQPWQ